MKRIVAVVLLAVVLVFAWIPMIASNFSSDAVMAAASRQVTTNDPGLPAWPY